MQYKATRKLKIGIPLITQRVNPGDDAIVFGEIICSRLYLQS